MNPVTNQELDQFYGREVTQIDRDLTIGHAASTIDADVLGNIVWSKFEEIASNFGDPYMIGRIIIDARKEWIADTASRELYRKAGMIKAGDVTV